MRAIVEAAVLDGLGKFREVVAQRLQRQVPQTELANAGRVDEVRAAAEVMKGGGGGGVPAGASFVQLAGGDVETFVERVEDRRLADAAVADQRARFSFHDRAQAGDAFARFDGTGDHRHAQRAVRIERGQLARAFVVVQQLDLVDADRRLRTAALNGDQEAIDKPRPQRRRFHRYDMDHDVNVCGDEALHARIERIGTREHGAARQNAREAAHAVRGFGDDAVADGERAFLANGELRRDETIEFALLVKEP